MELSLDSIRRTLLGRATAAFAAVVAAASLVSLSMVAVHDASLLCLLRFSSDGGAAMRRLGVTARSRFGRACSPSVGTNGMGGGGISSTSPGFCAAGDDGREEED